jgi:hypothetical protein
MLIFVQETLKTGNNVLSWLQTWNSWKLLSWEQKTLLSWPQKTLLSWPQKTLLKVCKCSQNNSQLYVEVSTEFEICSLQAARVSVGRERRLLQQKSPHASGKLLVVVSETNH